MACKCTNNAEASNAPSVNLDQVNGILETYDAESSNLITLLQEIQGAYGYLPKEALKQNCSKNWYQRSKDLWCCNFLLTI